MVTQNSNVIEEDAVDRIRREMRGSTVADVKETLGEAVQYVTGPVEQVFVDAPLAKAYALGVLSGAALIIIAHLLG